MRLCCSLSTLTIVAGLAWILTSCVADPDHLGSFIGCVVQLKSGIKVPYCYIAIDIYTWSLVRDYPLHDSIEVFCKQPSTDLVPEQKKGLTHFRSEKRNCPEGESCTRWSTLVHDAFYICCYEEEQCMRLVIPSGVEYKKMLTVYSDRSIHTLEKNLSYVEERYAIYYATIWKTFFDMSKPLLSKPPATWDQCDTKECLTSLHKTSSCLTSDGRRITLEGSKACFVQLMSSSVSRVNAGPVAFNTHKSPTDNRFINRCSPHPKNITSASPYLGDGECITSIKLDDYYVYCCCYTRRSLCGYTDDITKLTTIAQQNFNDWRISSIKRLHQGRFWTFRSFIYSNRPAKALKQSEGNQALWHCVKGTVAENFERWREPEKVNRTALLPRSKNCMQTTTFHFQSSSPALAERSNVTFTSDDGACQFIGTGRCRLGSSQCLQKGATTGDIVITCCCTGSDLCNQQDQIVKTPLCSSVYFEFESDVRSHQCSWYYDMVTKKQLILVPMLNAYIPREGIRDPAEELCHDLTYIPMQPSVCNRLEIARIVGRCWCPPENRTCERKAGFPMDKIRARLCFSGSLAATSSFIENDLGKQVRSGTNSSGDGLELKLCKSRPSCYLIMQMVAPGKFSYSFGIADGRIYDKLFRRLDLSIKRFQVVKMASIDHDKDKRKFPTLIHTCFAGVNKPACNGEANTISVIRKSLIREVRREQDRDELQCADSDTTTEVCSDHSGCFLSKGMTRPDDVELGCVERIPELLKRKPYLSALKNCNRYRLKYMHTTMKCVGIAHLDTLMCCCIGANCVEAFRNASARYGYNPSWYNIRV